MRPASIQGRAAEDLQFIRRAMERSSTFTAVPGAGGAAMGVVGLLAATAGAVQPSAERWLAVWLGAALIAFVDRHRHHAAEGGARRHGADGSDRASLCAQPVGAAGGGRRLDGAGCGKPGTGR